jgi:hypothetical protein
MSLAEYQRAFSDLIASPELSVAVRTEPATALAGYALSPREQRRLAAQVAHPGMSINCTLYRVNRLTPIYPVLPRTCALLGDRLMAELEACWSATGDATQQFAREATRFAGWLATRIDAGQLPSALGDALRFELAVFELRGGTGGHAGHEGASAIVELHHDPAAVLTDAARPEDCSRLARPARLRLCVRGGEIEVEVLAED